MTAPSRPSLLAQIVGWLRGLVEPPTRERTRGRPPSGNGASSFHLWWDLPEIPLREVAVTLEVVDPPTVPRLYFFALQASFIRRAERHGGAHLGLQWNQRHPAGTAANWGGYDAQGMILDGTESPLPSRPVDPNTRDYPWLPGRRYRLQIGPAAPRPDDRIAWPGSITDLETGETVVVRELLTGGDSLWAPVMWAEVFADCDASSVAIRWTDLTAITTDGTELRPRRCKTAYQSYANGGCSNTSSGATEDGFVQRTATERLNPDGTVLSLT